MSDNEIEDIQFLPGPSTGKRSVYEPRGIQRCKQVICSPTKAVVIIAVSLAIIFMVALIASLARPPSRCQSPKSGEDSGNKLPSVPTPSDGSSFPWHNIRLPTDVIPVSYDLFMHPNLTTFLFTGSVAITLQVQKTTNWFLFHAKNLTLTSYDLYLWDPVLEFRMNKLAISKLLENKENEQVYINTWEDLVEGNYYLLEIKYSGYCGDNLAGFYRSAYETPSKEKRWIVTTHFESSDARAAFPCFDEPALKAKFQMSMVRDLDHISLFNTEKIDEHVFAGDPALRVDIFAQSVEMSTYLVAFVVCDYKEVSVITESGKRVSVYAPAGLIKEASLAIDVAPKILTFYEEFYNVSYSLNKSDHIAVPDFAAGAMENWGLITYRMRSLLVSEQTASPSDKQWVVIVIAHELAHQWFGNLVTMTWWNDLWLNEGFASFMEYKGSDFVRPEWHMWDQFLISATWQAFSHDGLRSSHPISVDVTDPKEIEEIFDAISYDKGASIIRMCVFFLGEKIFREGLELYLNRYQYSNAKTEDLWMALSEKSVHLDVDVGRVMGTWTEQMGYPVVTVERHGNVISATQERFLYNPRGRVAEEYTSPYNYTWYIPLSYITSDTGYSSYGQAWMNKGPATITLDGNPAWVKVNVNVTGLYRVHYKDVMWESLIEQLQTDHTVFSAADRASLIEDAFALARSGYLPISKALSLTTYLSKETEYVAWATAFSVFNYIRQLMEDKGDYIYLQSYLLSLIQNQLDSNPWQPVDDHLQKFLQAQVLGEALHLQHQESIAQALKVFRDWMNNGVTPPPTLKSLIYAAGAKYGSNTEWDYLWEQYENPENPLEKKSYLRAMTATTDSVRIMRLLDRTLDTNKIRSADAVSVLQYLAANRAGQVLTWNFLKTNWDTIFSRYKGLAFQMKHIIDVSKYFSSEYYYNEVKEFFHENLSGQDTRSVNQALESIEMNIDWLKNNQKELIDWLKQHQTSQYK